MKNILSLLFLLSLISCSYTKRAKMISFTKSSVVISYTNFDLIDAKILAKRYCSSIGKDAKYVNNAEVGIFSIQKTAFFNCVTNKKL